MGAQRGQLEPLTIDSVLQTDVVTADYDDPIRTVVAKMADENVGSVVLVDADTPVGILTDRNVALALEEMQDVAEKESIDIAPDDLITGTTDMNVSDVVETLAGENVRRLPVVDEDGSLEGIVTLDDLLVRFSTELERSASVIEAQSPRY